MTRWRGSVMLGVMAILMGLEWGRVEAAISPEALDTIRHMAIQHRGRHKPFDSFAWESLKQITGSASWDGEDPVDTVLGIMATPEEWQEAPLIAVPFVPLREALGMDRHTTHVSYNELIASRKLMRMLPAIVQKQRRDDTLSMLENETMDAYGRFVSLSRLFEHDLELVPPSSGILRPWRSVLEPTGDQPDRFRNAWTTFILSLREGASSSIDQSARALVRLLESANPAAYPALWERRLEVVYNDVRPFHVARWIYLLAALGLFGSGLLKRVWMARWGMIALWAGFCCHSAGVLVRVVVGGRPPVSNFYETMLWLPLIGVLIALVLEKIYHARSIGLSAAILAAVTLLLADHVPLDSSIAPVVAVLRSTLWLTIHVLTIVASYGALALAMVLAHLHGGLYLIRGSKHPSLPVIGLYLYRVIQVGVVLLAGGIMLGAVWANASWGRYWGWDPKETWALITLLWFLAVLHGRFAGWIHGIGFSLATIGGFFLLLMTYYGVSFYLVGLHSYAGGHAKPLPPLLIAYMIAEVAFMALVGLRASARARATHPAS